MRVSQNILRISTSEMREVLKLKLVTNTSDGQGGYTAAITDVKDIYAKVVPMKDSRVLEAAQITYNEGFKIYCRYDAAINTNSLLGLGDQTLTIHSVANISSLNRYFEILAYTNG